MAKLHMIVKTCLWYAATVSKWSAHTLLQNELHIIYYVVVRVADGKNSKVDLQRCR